MKKSNTKKSLSTPKIREKRNVKQVNVNVSPRHQNTRNSNHKIQFEVWLMQVVNLAPEHDGRNVFIIWKRGSRHKSGNTKRALISKHTASWQEKIIFDTTLVKKDSGYENKSFSIKLKEERSKSVIGSCKLNLAKYTHSDGVTVHKCSITKKGETKLKFRIKSNLLRVGNQQVIGPVDINSITSDTTHIYFDDKQAFKTKTANTLTDFTYDDSLSDETINGVFSDKDSEISPKKSLSSPSRRRHVIKNSKPPSNQKQVVFSDNNNNSNGEKETTLKETIQAYEAEIDMLQKKNVQLQSQNRNYRKRLDKGTENSNEVLKLSKQKSDTDLEYENLQELNNALEKEKWEYRKKVEDLETQLKNSQKLVSNYEKELEKAKLEIQKFHREGKNDLDEITTDRNNSENLFDLSDPADVLRLRVRLAMVEPNREEEEFNPSPKGQIVKIVNSHV